MSEGFGTEEKKEWPGISAAEVAKRPIERLAPGSELHALVLDYLLKRLDASEREMAKFHPRWRCNEKKMQAYIDLPKWEEQLKTMNEQGKPPKVVSVVVPYVYASISTIVTYMLHTFAGRRPMLQVGSYKKETTENAMMMELVLQYNADHARLVRHLFQFLQDGEIYGVGVLLTKWRDEKAIRTVRTAQPRFGWMNKLLGVNTSKKREERTVYSGNDVSSVDPFLFFPDTRVPMSEVNRRGEYVFWRNFHGKHTLKEEEAAGRMFWIDHVGVLPPNRYDTSSGSSNRSARASGESVAGVRPLHNGAPFYQIDQGSVVIIPRELGLGESERPEKWLFTIANRSQIVQADPLNLDHNMHPVSVSEPYSTGYGFGNLGAADYMGPVQDTLGWLINSHMDNVRTTLNNILIVDPSMIEMQDLVEPGPGKLIRLKKSAYGRDVRTIISQLAVQDVTQGHIKDFELFHRMGDLMMGMNNNVRGVQEFGGRRTATESRTSAEAAASRLASHASVISAQAIVDMAEQMCVNIQQLMDDKFYISLVGLQGYDRPLNRLVQQGQTGIDISPEMLTGDFYFPVHDGTLPLDRVAMLDVWKQVFMAVAQDQDLRGQFNLTRIFEYLAELGGAQGLDRFKVDVQVTPPGEDPGAGPGMVPTPTPGVVASPGNRMAGGL